MMSMLDIKTACEVREVISMYPSIDTKVTGEFKNKIQFEYILLCVVEKTEITKDANYNMALDSAIHMLETLARKFQKVGTTNYTVTSLGVHTFEFKLTL